MFEPLFPLQQFLNGPCHIAGGVTLLAAIGIFLLGKLCSSNIPIMEKLAPLGKYTYIIYLFHFIVLGTITSWAYLRFRHLLGNNDPAGNFLAFIIYILAVSACCLLTPVLDTTAIDWSRRLKSYYINTRSSQVISLNPRIINSWRFMCRVYEQLLIKLKAKSIKK